MNVNRIGLIGLGIMGKPMANNLLQANHNLGLYARNPKSLRSFSANNIEIYNSPAELAEHCDITITIVSDSPDVENIITGNDGIIYGAKPKHLVIDMSTISPEVTRSLAHQLAAKDIDMLDAPVSGGEQGAIDGTLSIMVGGKTDVFNYAYPVLQVLGKNIVHIGDHGAGQVSKACNQILAAQTVAAVGEAFLLAKSSGVDPNKVRDALLGGFANSKVLELHGKRILDNNYKPGFKAELHFKDIGIALKSAQENNISIPGTEMVEKYLRKLVEQGDGELDSAAIAKIVLGE
ncbi:MAG: NAD(P)-dependent oxidoreductase [Gammaproteobacteria bacterium]|nr:NAD(P)-dependent oxidoreductase [Gammaproteobacteria bacterium]